MRQSVRMIGAVFVFLGLLGVNKSMAEDTDLPAPAGAPRRGPARSTRPLNWKSIIVAGASFTGKTDYNLKDSSGSMLSSSSDRAGAAPLITTELTYQPDFPLGASFLFEGTRYPYSGGGESDGQLGLLFMPRLASTFDFVELWAGVGVGLMLTNLGTVGVSAGGVAVTTGSPLTSFAWTPRIGTDFTIARQYVIGFQVSYLSTSGTASLTATNSSTGATMSFTEPFVRSWFGAALRFGARF